MPNGVRERRAGVSLSPRSAAPAPVGLGAAGPALGGSNQSTLERLGLPRLSSAQLQVVLAESERPIREWLDANIARVRSLSLAAATAEVLRAVPSAAGMGTGGVAGVVENWAGERGVTLPVRSLAPHPADQGVGGGGGGGLIDGIRRTVESATRGTAIVEGDAGEVRVSVRGATARLERGAITTRAEAGAGGIKARVESPEGSAEVDTSGASVGLRSGPVRVGARIAWSGQMSVTSSVEDLHFTASLSADRWSMRLSFPRAGMPQDLAALSDVFSQGASALGGVVEETATFRSIEEIPDLAGRISPHLAPVKRSIETASRVARTPLGVSFGVEVGGPTREPAPGAGLEAPRGVEARAVLTIRF